MKLYTYDGAPNPRRVELFLKYKGLAPETIQVNLMEREQLTPEYLAINPHGTVPALVTDDGELLTEVIGICDYLESLHPEKPLFGSTPIEHARVISWDHWLFVSMFSAIAEVMRNGNPAFAGRALPGPVPIEQIPALVDRGQQRLDSGWDHVEQALASTPFLCGENFSLADIDLLVMCDFVRWIKGSVPDRCSNVHAWRERALAKLPAD